MAKIIYISGVDGAGKTSVSKQLLKEFSNDDIKAKYTWATLRPFLLRPIIVIAKFLLVRKFNKFENYSKHQEHKKKSLKKFNFLMPFQFIIALIDYYPQYLFKVYFPSKLYDIIITDRYYIDFFIENGMLANWTPEKTYNKIISYQKIFKSPSDCIYIKISSKTSIGRKDDIPSTDYLEERIKYYNFIHKKLNSDIINGESSLDKVVKDVKDIL